ncbi:MAG: hypothetical protein C3F07_02270 [Anaerolineales bacterium]|nr:MAG: hypothetical protein C3F07_02270 [Anaerolineales bacterium]
MSFNRLKKLLIPLVALGVTLACGPFSAVTPQPAATLNSLYTAAAETLNAMSTQGAATQPSPTATLSISTPTPLAFETFTPVPPLQPVVRCDAASFVSDVTYPDGTVVSRGNTFTKTWRIKNTGTCTWTNSYALVFVSGEKFGAKNAVSLQTSVEPGKTVDLSVQLTAPNQDGRYRGFWQLRNASGVVFGFGTSGDAKIYVDVNVSGYTVTGYDLAANLCDANWRNADKKLPCPGTDGDKDGFAIVMDKPRMEDGDVRGIGLLTHPQQVRDGLIIGKYAPITIQQGDHFRALIGCLYKANDCNMIFKLDYQIGDNQIRSLGQWHEIYEGEYFPIDIDLSFLSGQNVRFILTVFANGSAHEDYALWVNPRITRQSSKPPTATFTPTPSPTVTATATQTLTATATATATQTLTPTATETPTETPTQTPTATSSTDPGG